jgi:hypothetical protein
MCPRIHRSSWPVPFNRFRFNAPARPFNPVCHLHKGSPFPIESAWDKKGAAYLSRREDEFRDSCHGDGNVAFRQENQLFDGAFLVLQRRRLSL